MDTTERLSDFVWVGGACFVAGGIYCMANDIFGAAFPLWIIGALSIKLGFISKTDGYRIVIANYFRYVKQQLQSYKQHKARTGVRRE